MFPFGLPDHRDHEGSKFKTQNPFCFHIAAVGNEDISHHQGQKPQRLKAAFRLWGEIVQAFSDADLTFETDKLMAISAAAREMKTLMQCRYLAGHWETDLIRQFSWYGRNSRGFSRWGNYRAPSWSWASVNDVITHFLEMYNDPVYQPLMEILEAHVELATEDEMGQVTGGHLRVRGQLVEIHRDNGGTVTVNGRKSRIRPYIDGGTNIPLMWGPTTLQCLPTTVSFDPKYQSMTLYALVLDKSDQYGNPAEDFHRIGLVEHCLWSGDTIDPFVLAIGKLIPNSDGVPVSIQQDDSRLTEVKIV